MANLMLLPILNVRDRRQDCILYISRLIYECTVYITPTENEQVRFTIHHRNTLFLTHETEKQGICP